MVREPGPRPVGSVSCACSSVPWPTTGAGSSVGLWKRGPGVCWEAGLTSLLSAMALSRGVTAPVKVSGGWQVNLVLVTVRE